jgi:hypothetical protein
MLFFVVDFQPPFSKDKDDVSKDKDDVSKDKDDACKHVKDH